MNMKRFQSPTGMTLSMMFIYLIQWGAQYIGYNYLPIYIDSLPFSTNSTTGLAIAVGAATTICVQPIWGRMAAALHRAVLYPVSGTAGPY